MRLLADALSRRQLKDFLKRGGKASNGSAHVVELLLLRRSLQPVLRVGDVFDLRLHEHPVEATALSVWESVVQTNEADESKFWVN